MKKPLKISLISLASLIGLIIIVLVIVFWIVLTPKRVTPLVNKYAKEFVTCDYSLDKVDITLLKTFPDVGVEIDNLTLLNKIEGCQNDTLAAVRNCIISLNVKELLFNRNFVINKASLKRGTVTAFFDKDGKSNFDILKKSVKEEKYERENDTASYRIDLESFYLNNINLSYINLASNTEAECKNLGLVINGNLDENNIKGHISLNMYDLNAYISNDSTSMRTAAQNFQFGGKLSYSNNVISGEPSIRLINTSFEMTGNANLYADFDNLVFVTNCEIHNLDDVICNLFSLTINGITANLDNEKYLDNAKISLNSFKTPHLVLSKKEASFENILLAINDIIVDFAGNIAMGNDGINVNANISTNTLAVAKTIDMIPPSILGDALNGINIDGNLKLNTTVSGVYNKESMPLVVAKIDLNNGYFKMPKVLPYPVRDINTSIYANLDLNNESDITIESLTAKMNRSNVSASGTIYDILGKKHCDMRLKAGVKADDIKSFLPDDIKLQTDITADTKLKGNITNIIDLKMEGLQFDANFTFNDLAINCFDTIDVVSKQLNLAVAFPRRSSEYIDNGFFEYNINGTDLNAEIYDMMSVKLDKFGIDGFISNILRDSSYPSVIGEFSFNHLNFNMKDIDIEGFNTNGSLAMLRSVNEGNVSYSAVLDGDDIMASMDGLEFATETVSLDVSADYDEKGENMLLKWNPKFDIDLSMAYFDTENLSETVFVPDINMKYDEKGLLIEDSRVVLGNSDFSLKGTLTNLSDYVVNNALLKGEFDFVSDYTDVNQLLGIFSGMGNTDTIAAQTVETDTVADDPFMVPLGTDIKLHTLINRATFDNIDIRNVGGDFTVKDGSFVLQQVGFTTDAAKMLLTAIYKSPRKNHLYLGFDFHLLDIDIAEMIKLLPDIDTIVPMLKSFDGDAEFHIAAETNLKSDYSIKFSTLKAACSIEGKDLVVLDNETFNKIKKHLMFQKETNNKIDSLDVQFTLFRNEIEVYPFVVSLDKYQAALYGRHNLNMSYDYNISVLNPPILNNLGLEIKGPNFDDMHFKLRKGKVKNIYKPEKRDFVEEKILELKKLISESLKDNVKKNY